jgi:hypothetical protein
MDRRDYGQCEIHMTSVTGHLMEMEFTDPTLRNWDPSREIDLFTATISSRVCLNPSPTHLSNTTRRRRALCL